MMRPRDLRHDIVTVAYKLSFSSRDLEDFAALNDDDSVNADDDDVDDDDWMAIYYKICTTVGDNKLYRISHKTWAKSFFRMSFAYPMTHIYCSTYLTHLKLKLFPKKERKTNPKFIKTQMGMEWKKQMGGRLKKETQFV